MRVLLDTNIILHREASAAINADVGYMYNWLAKIKAVKCIHPVTLEELRRYMLASTDIDLQAVPETIEAIKREYQVLEPESPLGEKIKKISSDIDSSEFDINDTRVLNEVYRLRADILISEDEKTHAKARFLGIPDKVLTIAAFLKKAASGETGPINHDQPASAHNMDQADLEGTFYDTLRRDFKRWDEWYNKTSVRKMGLHPLAFNVPDHTLRSWERFLKKCFDNTFTRWLEEILQRYF